MPSIEVISKSHWLYLWNSGICPLPSACYLSPDHHYLSPRHFQPTLNKQPDSRSALLSWLLDTICKEIFPNGKYDYISSLLKSFQWLLIIFLKISKLCNMGYESLYFLILLVLSLIILSLTCFDPALLKLILLSKYQALLLPQLWACC